MNVLISSLYDVCDPIISSSVKFGINKLIIFRQKESDKKLESAIIKLKDTFRKPNFDLQFVILDNIYDVCLSVSRFVGVIDSIPKSDKLFVNITGGRKTLSLGLLFGSYARANRIKEIIYVTEEKGDFVVLPKLDFDLSDSERNVLDYINKCNENCDLVITKLAEDIGLSRAMVYKVLTELETRNYITSDKDNKFVLTDAGKIVLL